MKIEHKTEKGTVLFVLQPEDASDLTYPKVGMIDLYFQTKVQSKHEEDNYISIGLPDVGFNIIGLTSEITETNAKMMLSSSEDKLLGGYKMYGDDNHFTAVALWSFKSLMQHLRVYEVNPFGKDYNCNVYNGAGSFVNGKLYTMNESYKGWQEAQSRTGKWIVLFKPND